MQFYVNAILLMLFCILLKLEYLACNFIPNALTAHRTHDVLF